MKKPSRVLIAGMLHMQRIQKNMRKGRKWIFFVLNLFLLLFFSVIFELSVDLWFILIGYSATYWMLLGFDSLEERNENHFILYTGPGHGLLEKIPYHDHVENHMQKVRKRMGRIQNWISFGTFMICMIIILNSEFSGISFWLFVMSCSIVFWILSGFGGGMIE